MAEKSEHFFLNNHIVEFLSCRSRIGYYLIDPDRVNELDVKKKHKCKTN